MKRSDLLTDACGQKVFPIHFTVFICVFSLCLTLKNHTAVEWFMQLIHTEWVLERKSTWTTGRTFIKIIKW